MSDGCRCLRRDCQCGFPGHGLLALQWEGGQAALLGALAGIYELLHILVTQSALLLPVMVTARLGGLSPGTAEFCQFRHRIEQAPRTLSQAGLAWAPTDAGMSVTFLAQRLSRSMSPCKKQWLGQAACLRQLRRLFPWIGAAAAQQPAAIATVEQRLLWHTWPRKCSLGGGADSSNAVRHPLLWGGQSHDQSPAVSPAPPQHRLAAMCSTCQGRAGNFFACPPSPVGTPPA